MLFKCSLTKSFFKFEFKERRKIIAHQILLLLKARGIEFKRPLGKVGCVCFNFQPRQTRD